VSETPHYLIDTSHSVAEQTLSLLRTAQLPATPRNYELFHLHVEGKSPAVSRDLQRRERTDGSISQQDADDVYTTHITKVGLSRDVVDLIQRFEEEVSRLSSVIDESGENANDAGEKLARLSTELKLKSGDQPALAALLDSVISVTRTVRDANEKLEQQLAQSSEEVDTLRRNMERIQKEAMNDPLTGVKNRKTFDQEIERCILSARKEGEPLALMMADVDHFKRFNDQWGHQTGDHVLRLVAEVMKANVKGKDTLARYGGEEFSIILPGTTLENAKMLADRMRRAIESRRLKKRRTEEDLGLITISIGVAQWRPNEPSDTLIERADSCLYMAKAAGRNRVVGDSDIDGAPEEAVA
jgi:diguanylate cyclase